MKPFRYTPKQKRQMDEKFRAQETIVQKHLNSLQAILEKGTDAVSEIIINESRLVIPDWIGRQIDEAMQSYYFDLITKAVRASQIEASQDGISRLAKAPPRLKKFRDLEELFRDKKQWQKIVRRASTMSRRLQELYLERLKAKFKEIIPKTTVKEHPKQRMLTPAEVKAEMRQAWKLPRARVETIFRTETTNYYAEAQIAYFDNEPEIIGFMFDSVKDTSRTEICKSRHGLIYRPGTDLLRKNKPALHYGCRSHLIPLANVEYNRKMLLDPMRDPNKVKVAPLPRGWRK